MDAGLTEIGGRDPLATDGPAPRRSDRCTAHTIRCAAVFVRSEKSNALVGDGVLQPAPRSANLDSAFGGMQLFATEAWRAAPLLLTHSAQPALGHISPEVRSIYSVDDKTCLPAGAEQEGPAHNPLVNSPSTPRTANQVKVLSFRRGVPLLPLRREA